MRPADHWSRRARPGHTGDPLVTLGPCDISVIHVTLLAVELPLLLLLLTPLLFGLSFLSGMLGLGVAFIAIPVLGLFGYDLINVIQPWALLLNGLTAISAAIAFWKAGMVDKRGALILVIVTTIGAPIGVWLLQFASTDLVWWLYVGVLLFLAVRMAMPKGASTEVVAEITDAVAGEGRRGRRADLGVRRVPRRRAGLPAHADAHARRATAPGSPPPRTRSR